MTTLGNSVNDIVVIDTVTAAATTSPASPPAVVAGASKLSSPSPPLRPSSITSASSSAAAAPLTSSSSSSPSSSDSSLSEDGNDDDDDDGAAAANDGGAEDACSKRHHGGGRRRHGGGGGRGRSARVAAPPAQAAALSLSPSPSPSEANCPPARCSDVVVGVDEDDDDDDVDDDADDDDDDDDDNDDGGGGGGNDVKFGGLGNGADDDNDDDDVVDEDDEDDVDDCDDDYDANVPETSARVMAKAFRAAKFGDDETARAAAMAASRIERYVVPREWMIDFMAWIDVRGDCSSKGKIGVARPGQIQNARLLIEERGGCVGGEGGIEHLSASSPNSGCGVRDAAAALPSGLSIDTGNTKACADTGEAKVKDVDHNDDDDDSEDNDKTRRVRRLRWRAICERGRPASSSAPTLREGLKEGSEYVLVGENVWTLLSSKFGYDVEVRLLSSSSTAAAPPEDDGGGDDVSLSDGSGGSGDGRRRHHRVLLPSSEPGKWEYGDAVRGRNDVEDDDDDAASDGAMAADDDDDDDSKRDILFPDVDETDTSKVSSDSEWGKENIGPILLLPPSTTSTGSVTKSTGHQLSKVSLDENRSDDDDSQGGADPAAASPNGMECEDNDGIGCDAVRAASASRKRLDGAAAPAFNKRKRCASGLGNLGNTCFMNSTLQCLAHTAPLRWYFITGQYVGDLNRANPLGTGGELANEFAKLLCQMWGLGNSSCRGGVGYGRASGNGGLYSATGCYDYGPSSVVYPREFKYTLGRHAEQFMGYDQHDSQELATFLIDALHEDTNRVTKKPYIEKPEQGEDESDDEAAEKAWDLHLKREDSCVLESFMGQVKSRVQCPVETCGRVSTTFDPFIFLSVPIPGATDRTFAVTYVPLDPNERMKTLRLTLRKTSSISVVRKKLVAILNEGAKDGSRPVQVDDICIADVWSNEVYSFYDPNDEIDKIRDSDFTFAFHLTSVSSIHEEEGKEHKGPFGVFTENDGHDEPKEVAGKRRPRTKLDLDTMTKLNRGNEWQRVLSMYLAQPLSLMAMTNPNRMSHEERMAFNEKIDRFIKLCRKCPDSVPVQRRRWRNMSEAAGENNPSGRPVSDVDFEVEEEKEDEDEDEDEDEGDDEGSDCSDGIDEDAPSLAERSEASSSFRKVNTPHDLAVLEFCARKYYQFCVSIAKEKKDKYKDGILIQVAFKKHTPPSGILGSSASSFANLNSGMAMEKSFGVPLVLRISPRLTVHGLRELLGKRLSRAVRSNQLEQPVVKDEVEDEDHLHTIQEKHAELAVYNGGNAGAGAEEGQNLTHGPEGKFDGSMEKVLPETSLLNQVAMTYERKSASNYKSHTSYRKLGALLKGDDGDLSTRKLTFASASDEGEQDIVADLVGPQGKVQLHWPMALAEKCFDDEEWERTEDLMKSDDDKDDAKTPKQVNVLDCISKYCQVEQLEETEMWYCNRCKDHVRAWKQFHLYRTPPILIVHLKRFHYSAKTHRRDKIDSFIDFPLKGLDLTNEVMHWEDGKEPIYDCYAVSNHYGGLGGGHYTAYAMNDDGVWCHFDDSRVTTGVCESEVKSAAAYVLYYRRRDVSLNEDDSRSVTSGLDAVSGSSSQTCSSPLESIDGDDEEANMDEVESSVVRKDNPQLP